MQSISDSCLVDPGVDAPNSKILERSSRSSSLTVGTIGVPGWLARSIGWNPGEPSLAVIRSPGDPIAKTAGDVGPWRGVITGEKTAGEGDGLGVAVPVESDDDSAAAGRGANFLAPISCVADANKASLPATPFAEVKMDSKCGLSRSTNCTFDPVTARFLFRNSLFNSLTEMQVNIPLKVVEIIVCRRKSKRI